jgi:hypothetical protein
MQNEKQPITDAKFDELYISSPKRRLLDAKDQAAYFEREVCSCATEYDDSPVLICFFPLYFLFNRVLLPKLSILPKQFRNSSSVKQFNPH